MLRTSSRVLVVLVGAMLLAAPGWTAAVDYTGFFITELSVQDPNNPPVKTLGAGTVVIPDAALTTGSIQIGAGIATTAMGYSDLGTNFYRIGTMTSPAPPTNPGGAIPVFIGGTAITVGNAAGTVGPSGVGALFGGQEEILHEAGELVDNGHDVIELVGEAPGDGPEEVQPFLVPLLLGHFFHYSRAFSCEAAARMKP